ncbi:hypothetical protein PbB2_02289 [Candidatus Phycosocius bacilliformis]|uniref:Glycerophosphoryl diester phosphodiesterase membrane domain-containing protein n=1 Tax=Candidatus Phycosocius bacilliformis TaxID=1445552 RepID=A0A2P2EC19_9PROT|nr:hypothetical protein [Candidatus Phycosocius bacilliformis]GBF58602.1 hypothetical protein PbB2_02289 [Candidatus Phycosocius bacilliformis]
MQQASSYSALYRFNAREFLGYDPVDGEVWRYPILKRMWHKSADLLRHHLPMLLITCCMIACASVFVGFVVEQFSPGILKAEGLFAGMIKFLAIMAYVSFQAIVSLYCAVIILSRYLPGLLAPGESAMDRVKQQAGKAVLLSFVVAVGISIGLALLILPGIFFMLGTFLALPLLVANRSNVAEAIEQSWNMMEGRRLTILALLAVIYGCTYVSGHVIEAIPPFLDSNFGQGVTAAIASISWEIGQLLCLQLLTLSLFLCQRAPNTAGSSN